MTRAHYDALVIGSGQAGTPLSRALAEAGWKVALIEREHVGGTCINEGCTPTKTMGASARVAYLGRRAAAYGVEVGEVRVDLARVRARKRAVVDSFRSSNEARLTGTPGLDWLTGEARFTGPQSLSVTFSNGSAQISAEHIFINVGVRPAKPPVPGLGAVPTLDSTSVMELGVVPEHLLVIGGGYVGLEFAQMFRRFGSDVTLVQHGPQLLGREDADVAAKVAEIVREDGVTVLLETTTLRADLTPGGDVRLTVRTPAGERELTGSHLLVAVGRAPNTAALGLGAAGVETDERGFIRVNGRLETNVPGVYALGDVKGGPAFTHIAYDDFRIVKANLLDGGSASTEGRTVPYAVFIDPQLGRVGLSEREAREQGFGVRVAKLPLTGVARAAEMGETGGFMKAVVDARTERILGFVMLGLAGGEVAAVVQSAMIGGLPYTALRDAVFAHPTMAESLNTLFDSFET